MKQLFISVLLALIVIPRTFSQTYSYNVFSDKHELLGDLKVTKTKTDTITHIEVVSQIKIKFKMLFTVAVKYLLTTIYHNDELYTNSIITSRNDEVYSVASTSKLAKQYRFFKDGQERIYSKKINFSEALLYFNEPADQASLYSEFDGIEKTIIKSAENHYKIKNPENGNISEYFYKNGVLTSAIVHNQLMALQIVKL